MKQIKLSITETYVSHCPPVRELEAAIEMLKVAKG